MPTPTSPSSLSHGPPAQAGGRVLIVNHDGDVAISLMAVLGGAGYRAEHATHQSDVRALFAARGRAAVQVVFSGPFWDRHGDPYAWLDQLRSYTTAAIVIGTRDPARLFGDYRGRGYAALLEEPFELDQLLTLMRALCAGPTPAGAGRLGDGHPGEVDVADNGQT